MKPRYIIGFLAVCFILFGLLMAGYQISYNHVMERRSEAREEYTKQESIAAEGEAVKEEKETDDGFYLMELHGFVAVYLSDKKTIYEFTEIPLTDLPEEVQQEVSEGKYINTQKELYAFLENYSS